MSVEYLNKHFTSLGDLKDVDNLISLVEGDKKLSLRGELASTPKWPESDVRVAELRDRIESAADSKDVEKGLLELDQLKQECGDLDVLNSVKRYLLEKKNANINLNALQEYKQIKNKIEDCQQETSSVTKLVELGSFIANLAPSDHTEKLKSNLRTKLSSEILKSKEMLSESFKDLVKQSNWLQDPKASPKLYENLIKLGQELLTLQSINDVPKYPETLWAFDYLIEPFVMRFNYHFESNKQTNRLDKPEWALNYLETFLEANLLNCKLIFNNILEKTPLQDRYFIYELITSLLVPIRSKISLLLPKLQNPRLLSHLIFELQNFDTRLENNYKYNPYVNTSGLSSSSFTRWHGLTGDVLNDSEVFNKWLNIEKGLAITRFTQLIEDENAFLIDFDAVMLNERKPTHSAIGLKNLIENITSHYQNINIIKYQLKFVSAIQLHLLDLYYQRLNDGLKAFENLFHSRLINNKEDLKKVQGLEGIERFCRLYCSSKYIITSMDLWGEELIFLRIWNSYKKIESHNESTVLIPQTTLFQSLIDSYEELNSRILKLIFAFFNKGINNSFKSYFNLKNWSTLTSFNNEVSSEVTQPLNTLHGEIKFLHKALSKVDNLKINNEISSLISNYLINTIIKNNKFNSFGLAKFKNDLEYTWNYLSLSKSNKSYQKLNESLRVLESDRSSLLKLKKDAEIKLLSDHEINDLISRVV